MERETTPGEIEHNLSLLNQQQEEEQRVLYWVTDFKYGKAVIPTNSGFHPSGFKGTRKEYNEKLTEIFGQFHENSNGKVIGSYSYTKEEWLDKTRSPKK